MEYADLIKLTQSPNQAERLEAENKLQQAKDANPADFMLIAARELFNNGQSLVVRVTSAALIKRMITFEGDQNIWVNIDSERRKQIKDFILASLASEEHAVKNLAASLIAEILAIELPLGQWRELVPQLAEKTKDSNPQVRKSAMAAIGEIAEKLKKRPELIDATIAEAILLGICLGLQVNEQNVEIRIYSIKALHESLGFMRPLLEKEETFKYVIVGVLENCLYENRKVRVQALRCVIDFCRTYYAKLTSYIEIIWKATGEFIKSTDSELAILSIEVWNTIASGDRRRKYGISESGDSMAYGSEQTLNHTFIVHHNLISYLIENLLKSSNFENDDEGELSIGYASFRTLCSVSEAIGDKYTEYASTFVANYLTDTNWINRRAAVLVFNSMIEGPSKAKIVPMLASAVGTLAKRIVDEKIIVAEFAATALAKIAEVHPECMLMKQTVTVILPMLQEGLNTPPRVSSHIAKAWSCLGDALKKIPNHGLVLDEIIDALTSNAFRSDISEKDYSAIENSLLGAMSLIHACQNPKTIEKFIEIFLAQLQKTGTMSGERRGFLTSGLMSCLQNALQNYKATSTNDVLCEQSYLIIIQTLQYVGDVTTDGIHALAAVAGAMGAGFSKHLDDFWKLLSTGLQRTNERDLFNACISAITEISRSCPDQFAVYLPDLVPFLVTKLSDQTLDKNLKLGIFTAIGDMTISCNKLIASYFLDLLKIYDIALEYGIKSPEQLSPEWQEYLETLRESFLESFTCFVHGIEESDKSRELFQYLPKVLTFLKQTCNKLYNPTLEYLKNALALLADIGNFYGNDARQIIDFQFVDELIKILRKAQGRGVDVIIEYAENIFLPMIKGA
eukprot:CAMPEP_0176440746 /NCGR_PEP_ID=MMETSP0127-20121128/20763_1 /TAXON_ID=938130 /ORGANISM="Platyophrya macrostoma, Strain WH" /LENGTH=849 /DNA_ID=CAMNT_0017825347 /DNA_START=37 /DNA_END=2586 /DNA_ORIENTATION=-